MWLERIFPVILDDDTSHYESLLDSFRRFLVLQLTAEAWFVALSDSPDRSSAWAILGGVFANGDFILPTLLAVALGLVWTPASAGLATALAAIARTGFLLQTFPYTANHVFLEILCCLVLLCFDRHRADERRLALGALRWITAILFFYTGLQKLWYGHYFHAEYLAIGISWDNRYAEVLGWLLPGSELERLRAIGQPFDGSGPYTVEAPLLVLLSNLVWMGEIALGILLVPRTWRTAAVGASLLFMLFTQLTAREVFFGGLFTNLLLLSLHRDWIRLCLPAFGALYAFVVLTRLGILAEPFFN